MVIYVILLVHFTNVVLHLKWNTVFVFEILRTNNYFTLKVCMRIEIVKP